MIRDGLFELLLDVIKALGSGTLAGVLYACISSVVSIIAELISSPSNILAAVSDKNGIKKLWQSTFAKSNATSPVQVFFSDFIALTLIGFGFIVLTYICNDGIFRAYLLIAFAVSTLVSYFILGRKVRWVSLFLFGIVKNICMTVAVALIRPFFVLICHSIKHLKPSLHLDKILNK